jgi:heme oxygenase (biliverdin-producing, ferredoxin)
MKDPTVTVISSDTVQLSTLLREGSQAEHTQAEESGFMTQLMRGGINARGYADYLARLRRVYAALEDAAATLVDDPIAGPFIDPALERLAALDADLEHWGPGDGTSAATDAYVARIDDAARWGGTFLAHHYTRYLGDLSGGQVAGRLLSRELGPEGLTFYAFPAIPKPKPYKDAYRAKLDAAPLTPAEKSRVLDEVKATFQHNGALFSELGANLDRYRRTTG